MMTLADPLEHARSCFGHRTAVIDGDRTITYDELADRCARLAAVLADLGVQRGDRVALLSANGHRYLEAFFGLPAAGIVLVLLNTRLAPAELAHIVQHSGTRVLITDRDPAGLDALVEHVIGIPGDYERMLDAVGVSANVFSVAADDVAALFYTGGTTGLPKGVMLTHGNLIANAFKQDPSLFARGRRCLPRRTGHVPRRRDCPHRVGLAGRHDRDGADVRPGAVPRSHQPPWGDDLPAGSHDARCPGGRTAQPAVRRLVLATARSRRLTDCRGTEPPGARGVPDERWGEAVHAIVVPHAGVTVTAEELRAHCRELIAGYKVPKVIDISIEPLPKSGPGKILKRVLRDRYLAE